MPATFPGQALGLGVDLRRILHQVALAAIEGNLGNLFLRGAGRYHGNEGQTEQTREVGFGNRRRAAGCFDHRRARAQPAITQGIEKQRPRQPVLETAGGVARLILEIQLDLGKAWQRQRDQVSVGATLEVRFDNTDGFTSPLAVIVHGRFSGKKVEVLQNMLGKF
ncbi:hypothetical protein D9M71_633270 [compost metagenome]